MRRIAVLCSLLMVSCGGKSEKSTEPTGGGAESIPPKAAKAAAIANDLQANPDDADAILERHGMTRQQFEDLMYEIAEDEELSEAYNRAR